jgi:DNA mismatch repair protein MutS
LAGLPGTVITRAQEILSGLERDELSRGGRPTLSGNGGDPGTRQLGLFASTPEPSSPQQRQIAERLKAIDVDETTPRQALELLAELKKLSEQS